MSGLRRLLSTRHIVIGLAVALILSVMLPFALPRAVAQTTGTATVTTPRLNVRSGPGAGYSVVTVVDQGAQVTLIGRNANSSWAKLQTANGIQGWASTYYLNSNIPFSDLPVVNQPAAPSEPTAYANSPSLNVRSGPSPQYSVIAVLSQNQVMGLVGRNEDGSWAQVRVNTRIGWVDSSLIIASVPIVSLPVVSIPPTPTMPPLGPTATPSATATPNPATPQPAAFGNAMITAQRLNVRSGAGPGYMVITTVGYGDRVALVGRNTNSSWVRVQLKNAVQGWISSAYILTDYGVKLSDLPVAGEVQLTATVNTGTVNVRSGPGPQYSVITTLNEGALVSMVARNSNGSWVKIGFNGLTGWVDPTYLDTPYTINSLPVATQ